jgi:uncharacterized RDD family membrane protein YckC
MPFDPYRLPSPSLGGPDADLHALVAVPGLAQRWVAAVVDGSLTLLPVLGAWTATIVMATLSSGADGQLPPALQVALGPGIYPLVLVAQVLYGALFEASSWQATPGKRLLGLRVISEAGGRLSLPQALIRNATKALGLLLCNFLAFSVLVDDKRRGVWDRVVGTRVIPVRTAAGPAAPAPATAAPTAARRPASQAGYADRQEAP